MDVGLVLEYGDLVGGKPLNKPIDGCKTLPPEPRRPRAAHDRLRASSPRPDSAQQSAHGAEADSDSTRLGHNATEQLARPGRSAVAILLRRATQHRTNLHFEPPIGHTSAVVAPPIEQRQSSTLRVALHSAIHVGADASQQTGDVDRRSATSRCGNDLNTPISLGVLHPSPPHQKRAPPTTRSLRYAPHRRTSCRSLLFHHQSDARQRFSGSTSAIRDPGSWPVI